MSNLITENKVLPLLKSKEADIIRMIGRDNLTREMSFALQAVNSNDYLAKSTPASVAKCVVNIAFTGLSLNPVLKYAYITPRRVNNQVEAILMPSYIGLCKLITDAGSVRNIYAYLVHEGDEFEPVFGTELGLIHKPKFGDKVTHAYAVAVLNDGSKQFEVMTVADINEIRERSDGYKSFKAGKAKSCIWVSDYGEMAKKTVIKRLTKYLPKTEKWEKIATAIDIDNQDYPATEGQIGYIERLLEHCTYEERQKEYIQMQVNGGLTIQDAETIINGLQMHQLEPISAGLPYGQTDIKNKIKEEITTKN